MSELSPRAQELLKRASTGGGPTEAQRKAVKRGVMAVGVASTLAAAATTKFLIIGLTIGAAAGALAVVGLRGSSPHVEAPQVTPAQPAPPVEVIAPQPRQEPPSDRVEPPRVEKPKIPPGVRERPAPPLPPSPAPISTLARELAALDHAVRAIDAGQFEQGLSEARDFLEEFPESELALEARVVEVLALCGLSRVDEAQSIVSSFALESRRNPAVRRLENSCVELSP
jgi:hypothetical protein